MARQKLSVDKLHELIDKATMKLNPKTEKYEPTEVSDYEVVVHVKDSEGKGDAYAKFPIRNVGITHEGGQFALVIDISDEPEYSE